MNSQGEARGARLEAYMDAGCDPYCLVLEPRRAGMWSSLPSIYDPKVVMLTEFFVSWLAKHLSCRIGRSVTG